MLRKALLTATLCFACHLQAADQVTLKVEQLDNKTYQTTTKMAVKNEINFEAPKETMDKLKESGVTLPIKVDKQQTTLKTIETFPKNAAGEIPFKGTLEYTATQKSNAPTNGQNQSASKRYKTSGVYKKDGMVIDSVEGMEIKPGTEEAVKKALAKMMEGVEFPQKPLKVGESFTQSAPLSLPVQGGQTVDILMTTKYTLKNIKGTKAYFDIKENYTLSSNANQGKVMLKGKGGGTMVYDSALSMIVSQNTVSTMDMDIDAGTMKVFTKTKTKSDSTTSISDRK